MNRKSNSGDCSTEHHFLADQPNFYKIRIEGILDQKWSTWFEGFSLTTEGNVTVLAGWVADPPALYGLLTTISDLGLPLISVERQPAQQQAENGGKKDER